MENKSRRQTKESREWGTSRACNVCKVARANLLLQASGLKGGERGRGRGLAETERANKAENDTEDEITKRVG